MKVKLKESLSNKKTLLVLSLLSVLCALLCVILSDILLPLLIAVLAVVLCFDQGNKKIYSYSCIIAVLAISIAGGYFVGQFLMFWGVQAIILAWLISSCCSKGKNKMECAFICTLIYAAFIVVSFIVLAMIETDNFTLEAASKYYTDMIAQLRPLFVDNLYTVFSQAYRDIELSITPEMLSYVFDSLVGNIVSFIIISGFVCCGIAFKIFSFITMKYTDDKDYMLKWRFTTPNLYAYFYLILVIVSLFTASSTDVLAICVSNLYNIFMVVYAYLGFNYALGFLSRKRKSVFAFLLLMFITVMFFNFAVEILAMIGAFGTIRKNKEIVT